MKLKSFGCSFVFGTDLPDDGRFGPLATPSHCSYPALIARARDLEYICYARPGAGNFEILCQLIEQIARNEPAVYVINWTWIDRFSYIDKNKSTGLHPFNPHGWHSIMPIDTGLTAEVYYRDLHSQLRDKIESLICISSAIDCLQKNHCQFIMTWTDSLLWEQEWHCPVLIRWLQQKTSSYVSSFQGDSFLNWSRNNGFDISSTMHPLEAAHQAAADMILTNWHSYLKN